MSPIRAFSVTIDWILMILTLISLIWLIVAAVKHNKLMARKAAIAFVVCFVLLVIAFRFALTV